MSRQVMSFSFREVKRWLPPSRLFAKLTITGKMFAGYGVLALLTFSVVVYVLVSLFRINSLNRTIVHVDVPVQIAVDKMSDALLTQNVFEKRYLILRRKDLRHLFWERAKEFDTLLEELKQLPGDFPLPLAKLDNLHSQYGDHFLELVKHVQAGEGAAAEALSNGPMREAVERMLDLLRDITPRSKAAQDARMRKISETSSSAIRTTVLLCIVSIAVGALAGLLVTAYISLSLRRLKAVTGRIAEGNFENGLQTTGEDELGDLARSFDAMGRRLDSHAPLAFCVMDLDNFKAFNDRYGYAHGNVVIKDTAKIVEQASRTHGAAEDFVGHVGGDDFVVVTTPDRMNGLCDEIIKQFDGRVPQFYNDEDRGKGYIFGKTRQGVEMKFPLMTISIAIVTNLHRTLSSPLEASETAAELKDYAKTFNRSLYVIDKRRA